MARRITIPQNAKYSANPIRPFSTSTLTTVLCAGQVPLSLTDLGIYVTSRPHAQNRRLAPGLQSVLPGIGPLGKGIATRAFPESGEGGTSNQAQSQDGNQYHGNGYSDANSPIDFPKSA